MRVKRHIVSRWLLLVGMIVVAPAVSRAATKDAGSRPNVVYVLADDLGWKDVGFHGSDIQTPHIDSLAKGGARLEQFYTQPMCTPSRAALMTGRYPHRYGLQTAVIPSAGTYGLPTDERLLPQSLAEAGYQTSIVGKWHLGHADKKYWPQSRGFDRQYGALLGEIDYYTHSAHGVVDWFREGEPLDEKGYATQLIGDEAVKQIGAHDTSKPLFLYLTFTAPHAPYQAPQEYVDRYGSIADTNRRTYAAMVTALDDQIGRVVKALEDRKMRENTLIVFASDNGGPRDPKFTGEVDTSGGTTPADNGPWREGKGTLYEGGTRVVSLVNWPGHIAAGTVVDQPLHQVDMYPTLAGLAGASTAGGKPLDGLDAWDTIAAGKPSPRTEVVYGIEPFRAAVRKGNWKLVWWALLPSRVELYDLARDPGEKANVASANPEIVKELQARAESLAKESAPPFFLTQAAGIAKEAYFGSVAIPGAAKAIEAAP
ncbi:MAG: arylsulfatase [Deltaproteobacteria bacterium]|nr:arylsulfatase [Deltaproteobacteria bacterium]